MVYYELPYEHDQDVYKKNHPDYIPIYANKHLNNYLPMPYLMELVEPPNFTLHFHYP